MVQQLHSMLSNDLHLLSQLDNGIQLLGVGALDQLSLQVLQLCLCRRRLFLNLVQLCLQQLGLGRAQPRLRGIEDLLLEVRLPTTHLAQRIVLGAQVLYLFAKRLVLGPKAYLVVADLANQQVKFQEDIAQVIRLQ